MDMYVCLLAVRSLSLSCVSYIYHLLSEYYAEIQRKKNEKKIDKSIHYHRKKKQHEREILSLLSNGTRRKKCRSIMDPFFVTKLVIHIKTISFNE